MGRDWENQIENVHRWYRLRKIADIVKNPSEWIFIGEREYEEIRRKISCRQLDPGKIAATDNGRFMKLVPSDIDFSGGGRGFGGHFAIAFDAKATMGNRLPLANVKAHQVRRLVESARCGCLAGFLVLLSEQNRAFFVPADFMDRKFVDLERSKVSRRRAAPGAASLSLPELEQNAVEIFRNKSNGLWDYLPRLLQ